MTAQSATKIIPLTGSDDACLKCGIKNSHNNHFCRFCGHEVNLLANQLSPEKCLHKSIRQKNLYKYNYCPTCRERIMSLSVDEPGLLF